MHYTPTGDNPHAACPSRPRWGVTPYIGRSSPGQILEVSHLIIFWPPILIKVRTGFGAPNEVPKASQMTSKIDQMKDWSRKPFSEDKKYHSFISSDFQRDLPPLQNHAKTDGFSKIFLDALHLLVVRFAYQIKSKNSSRMVSKSQKNDPQSRFKTIVISTCFYKLPRTRFLARFGIQNRPQQGPPLGWNSILRLAVHQIRFLEQG